MNPRINHRLLIRTLKQRPAPALRYWYTMSSTGVDTRRLITRVNLVEKRNRNFFSLLWVIMQSSMQNGEPNA
ncbi:MAG TPA: hypothetical protein VKM55_29935 [Candidatus Lokiarchaeia archaeon]|nr:hypothetical protein [Candidatus Lokiarchaeia archaeon]